MSLIFVQHFVYDFTSYTCYYDTGANNGTVDISGPNPHTSIPLPNSGNSNNPGDPIGSFCSDNPNTTRVNTFASETTPFFTWTLIPNSGDCPYIPPGSCDIQINSLTIVNEQSTGANDGQVTINASSTGGTITYSLDGSTWVSSNVFTELAPGNYTAYAIDTSLCETSQPFTILAYNNPVQSFEDDLPTVAIAPSNISKWNAAFNPIVVQFQRKDFTVTGVALYGVNQIAVTLSTALTFNQSQLAINDAMYFKTLFYEFYGVAVGYNVVGGVGVLIINEPYTVNDTSGYLNINGIKPGYYVECQLTYGTDAVHPKYINPQYSPNNKGATRADLAPFLQTLLSAKDTFNYANTPYRDLNLAQSYQLQFREIWTGGNGLWFDAPYPLYATFAARQLGEPYDGNMADYVPFQTVTNDSDKAKFLTDFNQPIFWQDLPFEVSFIYGDDLSDKDLFLEFIPDCGAIADGFLLNAMGDGYIINADGSRIIVNKIDVGSIAIPDAIGVIRCLIPNIFDCCAQIITANVYYVLDTVKIYVMEQLEIRNRCSCDSDPYVYLKWINSRGAWDYYRFGYNQFTNASISNDQAVKRFVLNWTTDDTIEDVINKSSIRSLKCGAAHLEPDEANALQWARKSIKAMILVSINPVKWQTVIVKDGSTDTLQSRKKLSEVNFELLLVSENIQNQ